MIAILTLLLFPLFLILVAAQCPVAAIDMDIVSHVVRLPRRPSPAGLELEVRAHANVVYIHQYQDRSVRFIKQEEA